MFTMKFKYLEILNHFRSRLMCHRDPASKRLGYHVLKIYKYISRAQCINAIIRKLTNKFYRPVL